MRIEQIVKSHVGELKNYQWLSFTDGGGDSVLIEDAEDIASAAEVFKMTPEAVEAIRDALQFMAQTIIEEIEKDFQDLWEVATAEED